MAAMRTADDRINLLEGMVRELDDCLKVSADQALNTATLIDQMNVTANEASESVFNLQQEIIQQAQNFTTLLQGMQNQEPRAQGHKKDKLQRLEYKKVPDPFEGDRDKHGSRTFAKKMKAYCNGRASGFRDAMEWAQQQNSVITREL